MTSSIPSWARPGVRVVCINDQRITETEVEALVLVEGRIYTVAAAFIHRRTGLPALTLDETLLLDLCHWAGRFRPVVEPKSEAHDLAMFRDLLRQPERA